MQRFLVFTALLAVCLTVRANTCVPLQAGATDQSVYVEFIDESTGIPNSSLAFNSSGIDLEYVRSGAAAVDITEATQTASGAHSDGGFVSVGHGRYRLDLPDAAVATGVPQVVIQGTITGYIMLPCVVALSPPVNVVRFGGTDGTFTSGRPNVNASHLGGTSQTGRDIGASVLISSGTGTGQLSVTSGVIASNVTQFGGSAGTFASGRPEVNASHWGGTAVASATVNANMTQVSGDSGAADALEAAFDGTAGAVSPLGIARQGTAQSATSTTLVLDSSASFADDVPIGMTLLACGSTQGYCQARAVTDYTASSDTATVDTWTVTPSGTITYYLFGTAPFEIEAGSGSLTAEDVWTYNDRQLTALDEDSTTIDLNDTAVGSVAGTVGSVTGAVGSVTGNVGGNVTGSVGSVTGNVGGTVNGLTATAQGNVRTALGMSSANLDTQLGDIPTVSEFNARTLASASYATASDQAAVKAVTDNLPDSGALTSLASATDLATAQTTLDKLDDTLEDNSGTYRFTEAALAQAPAGEGGGGTGTDWDADERAAIRSILGIPVSGSTPADPSSGILDTIRDGITGLNDLSSEDVQSAVESALDGETCDEPTGKPSWATSTMKEWVCWIGAWSRNKVQQTSTTKTLRNDADDAAIVTCGVSDDGTTFTLNECTP